MQDGCKVSMDSYMASNGSYFMVTWIVFKNYFLEIGLTQNQETMALQRSKPLIYSILSCVRTRMNTNSLKYHLVEGSVSYGGSKTTLQDFGGVLGRPLDTFFWTLTISWSWLLARTWCGIHEVALS